MPDITEWQGAQGGVKLSKAELLARYRERVLMSRRWRKQEKYDDTWDRLRDLYSGKQFTQLSDQDRIAVNIAFSTVNVIAPSIAVNHPKITVWARGEADDDRAVITEAVVNYWWRHFDFKPQFRRAVKDYLIIGHGWLKVGYRYEEHPVPLTDDQITEMFHLAKSEADDYAAANPDTAHLLPTNEELMAGLPSHETKTIEDRPFVERVSPYDIFIDPEATCVEDALWIAQRIVRPLEEVRADKRYPQGVRRKLEADGELRADWRDDNTKYGDDVKRVVLWEFYDLQRKTMSVFTDSGERFLVDPIPFPYTFGIPFVMLRNYDKPDEFYPMGDLEAIAPLQDELNSTRSDMVQARQQNLPKTMYRTSLSPAALNALRSDDRNTLVPIDDDAPFNELIAPVPQGDAVAELYHHSEVIEADVDRISGVNEYMRGAAPETRRTATEASIIQDAANARVADKLEQIEDCIGQVARRVVQLAQQYITGQQSARVMGPNNQAVWAPFSRHDIQGEFDFSVEAGSTQPMNESFRRQQATQLLTALQPYAESGTVDIAALLTYTLQFGFGIANPGRFVSQQPKQDPGPQEKLIETINYKDAPPDIQRQIEAQAGMTPSQIGGSSPADQLMSGVQASSPGGDNPSEGSNDQHQKPSEASGPQKLSADASNRQQGNGK